MKRLLFLSLAWSLWTLPLWAAEAQTPPAQDSVSVDAMDHSEPATKLTLEDCIAQALKANLGLKIERLSPQISALELERQWAQYGLTAGAEAQVNQNISPTNTAFISGASILNQVRQNYNLFLQQDFATGGNLRLGFDNGILNTNSSQADINPAYTPRLSLDLKHPLLRNNLNGLRQLDIQANNRTEANWSLKNQAIDTVAQVQSAYWDLVLYRERLRVLTQSLKILEDLLEMNQEKEKAGFMSRIDVLQTEARIASSRAGLLDAKRNVENTEDRLKQLLNPETVGAEAEPFVQWDASLLPVDQPEFKTYAASVDKSYQVAMKWRPDYQNLLLELDNRRLQTEIAAQNRLPDLSLQGSSGLESLDGSYPNAVGKLFSLQTYFWSLGLNFEVPVVGNGYEVQYQEAQLQQKQAQLRLDNGRQQILREIRQGVRNVQMAAQQVEATRLAKKLAEEQLKAQTEKLNLGLTTNFQVLQFQSDYQSASLAEVNAVVAYIQAINQLQQSEGSLLEVLNLHWEASS